MGMLRASLLALLFILGAAVAGCGAGGMNGSSETSASSSASTSNTAPAPEGRKDGEASIEEFGSDAKGSERRAILSVFTGYLGAIARKDFAAACSNLSATVHKSLRRLAGKGGKRLGCVAILPELLAPTASQVTRAQAGGKVARVRVQGDRGFVVFHAPGAKLYEMPMAREGGEWKVGLVGASVLVPSL